jgi:hypothetical protein
MAASAYHLGHVFLRAGQLDQAIGVTMAAARALELGLSAATPEHLSAWGALHLTAVIAVARQDDRAAVRQLLGEARTTADRLGQDRNDFWTAFGPTNAVSQRKSAGQLARLGGRQPAAPELDPAFVQLNAGNVPRARGHTGTPAVRLRRAEEIEALGYRVVADMNRESRPQRPSVRHRTVASRAERAQQLAAERASRPQRRQAERTGRHERVRTDRAQRSARPHHQVSYRGER